MNVVNSETLINAQRDVTVPFNLKARLEDGQEVVVRFLEILRLLPGKRIVALAECGNHRLLVKMFLGRTAGRYAAKERAGLQYIIAAGVPTPSLLWQADVIDGHGQLLAFEYLENSLSLQDQWNKATADIDRVDVLTGAMIIIARLHNQGILQTDIHLANFLMSQGQIYMIDGGGVIRKSEPPLRDGYSLDNLSLFFAQFFPKFDDFARIVFPAYESVRGWSQDPTRIVSLHEQISRSRESRKKAYLDKTFRDCTRFVCRSSFRRFMVCERSVLDEEMEGVLQDPDKFIASGHILKNGNSATVARVRLSSRSLVIKRYNIKNVWHQMLRACQKSRAWTSWSNAFHMEFLGIRSLKPVAILEHRMGPLRGKAYFITEYVKGPDALVCLGNMEKPDGELEAIAMLLRHLFESRISHGDMKATNILMTNEGPVIIDLDAMRQHRNKESFRRAFNKDLDRFMKNWENHPELAKQFEGLLVKFPS